MLNTFFFFFMNATKFLNPTTAPTCNSWKHVAMTIPCVPVSLHLISYSCWSSGHLPLPHDDHYYGDLPCTQPVSDIVYQFSTHPCSWSSSDSFDVLFPMLSEGSGGGTVFIKPTAVRGGVVGLDVHSPLTAASSPSGSIHAKCLIQMGHFLSSTQYFYYSFSMFRYANT